MNTSPISTASTATGPVTELKNSRGDNGGDIRFIPGRGINGGSNGKIVWCDADGNDLLSLDVEGLHLKGKLLPLNKILELLSDIVAKDPCKCSSEQVLNHGCICGGI